MKTSLLLLVALWVLASAACGGKKSCQDALVGPGCVDNHKTVDPLPPAVLEIASISVIEYRVPGAGYYDCEFGCEALFVDVVEKTGLGRATVTSVSVEGNGLDPTVRYRLGPYSVPGHTSAKCTIDPGQRRRIVDGAFWNEDDQGTVGFERTITVRYDDGAGGSGVVSATALVTQVAEPTYTHSTCDLFWN